MFLSNLRNLRVKVSFQTKFVVCLMLKPKLSSNPKPKLGQKKKRKNTLPLRTEITTDSCFNLSLFDQVTAIYRSSTICRSCFSNSYMFRGSLIISRKSFCRFFVGAYQLQKYSSFSIWSGIVRFWVLKDRVFDDPQWRNKKLYTCLDSFLSDQYLYIRSI